MMKEIVLALHEQHFGRAAKVVRAPGRVNLIGEHTDYNDGFVLPLAIERAVWIAFSPAEDGCVELVSHTFGGHAGFAVGDFWKEGTDWIEYVKGVASVLRENGVRLKGWRGVVASDVPVGSGLSSSAALEMAVGRVFENLAGVEIAAAQLALHGQKAENRWIGVNCGIMDQLASAAGQAGQALLIDCRSLAVTPVPMPKDCHVVIMDTGTRRQLQHSAYNERRSRCEEGAHFFGRKALRDVNSSELPAVESRMDPTVYRRSRHVVTENERTALAADMLRAGKSPELGRLMNESHDSLRFDFEVSSPALDLMVEVARARKGCLGARMTGAGFGGCAVALVESRFVEDFIPAVSAEYQSRSGNTPSLFATRATAGAGIVG